MFGKQQQVAIAPGEIEVQPSPSDGISQLRWCPSANVLASSQWDGKVSLWEIDGNGASTGLNQFSFNAPVLSLCWTPDGAGMVAAVGDGSVVGIDAQSGNTTDFGLHDAPTREVCFVPDMNAIASGSWDRSVRFWDVRSPNMIGSIEIPDRVWCMDVCGKLLVVAAADHHYYVYNLDNPNTPFSTLKPPLTHPTQSIRCLDDKSFVVGGVEGRVGIQYVLKQDENRNFSFKAHRKNQDAYPVNDIAIHPQFRSFATVGGDGSVSIWDPDNRGKLFPKDKQSISNNSTCPTSACAFNGDGTLLAYSICYDWHRGVNGADPSFPNRVIVRSLDATDVTPVPTQQSRR